MAWCFICRQTTGRKYYFVELEVQETGEAYQGIHFLCDTHLVLGPSGPFHDV